MRVYELQLNKDNTPPKKSVFEIMQKIDQIQDFANKIEIALSHLREEKNRHGHLIMKHYQIVKLMTLTQKLNTTELY